MAILIALILLLLPGLAFVRRAEWECGEPFELAGVAFASSAAYWAVSFWLLEWIPLSWRFFAGLSVAAALLLLAFRRRDWISSLMSAWRRGRGRTLAQVGLLAGVLALRLAFAQTHVAYSGGDMTAHAALTEKIDLKDGFPRSQEPLLPILRFGEIAPGFHALSALVSLLSGAPSHRTTIYILCLAIAGMTAALYALLRSLGFAPAPAAAASIGALLLARNPQFFLQWGGAPSVLAAAIGLICLRDVLSLGQPDGAPARAGFLGAGMLLVHPLPAVALAWMLPALLLLRAFSGRTPLAKLARDAGVAALAALVLVLPFLLRAPRTVAPEAVAWARDWFRAETRGAVSLENRFLPDARGGSAAATWPFFLVSYLGALPVLLLAAGLARGLWRRRAAVAVGLSILLFQLLLFVGALAEALPGWPALYPTRVALWLVVPLGIAMAELSGWAARASRRIRIAAACLFLIAFGLEGKRLAASRFGTAFYGEAKGGRASAASVLANEAAGGAFWVTTFCRDDSAVTAEDISAFAWIRSSTPDDAVFANNPGDGGSLLPAAAHRKILEPHYYWFFDRPSVEAWRATTRIDYVYVGAQPAPAWDRWWTAEQLDSDARVELVHQSGRARVYRIREGFADEFRSRR
ncbi:MAG TPA: DUF6541 family protein [Thermoanaerobaculia bacterium]|nr:DUF6541 family protein [Thermoanaerobaculia bacterium]